MRLALTFLRGMVFVKHHAGPVLRGIALPFVFLARALLLVVGIPLYRGYFFLRRLSGQVIGIAENRLSFLVTNSRVIHVTAFALVAGVIAMNVTAGDVRAESFGRQSILYNLVSTDDVQTLEKEEATPISYSTTTSYREDTSIGASFGGVDFGTEYATTNTGGIIQPLPGSGSSSVSGAAPVPVRSETIDYQVADGDTLGGIASRFGLSLNTILWANKLTARSTIRPGLTLHILPEDGVLYAVKKGDTIGKIASTLGADSQKITEANRLAGGTLSVGAELFVPGGKPVAAPLPVKRSSSVTDLFSSGKVVFAPKPDSAGSVEARGSASGQGTWVWPTDWRIITQYFSWKHTGLDIGASYATHSYATADGTVVYAGWRTGYGMTVEVDHGNGYITRYAHNSKLYVNVGDVVQAGDMLAQSGSTGNSTGPHLHFEVIKNGKFQNPLEYIQ